MKKIWLDSYPDGVPAEIDTSQYRSVAHLLEESMQRYASHQSFVCMGKSITYAELDQLSQRLGAWLQSRGLTRGARVALMMPNVLQYPIAITAVLRAGYTVVNVNPLYTARELKHQLNDSGAEAIVILENFACTLQQVIAETQVKHVVIASVGELLGALKGAVVNLVVRHIKKAVPAFSLPMAITFKQALAQGASATLKPIAIGHDDIAFLQYTGGTTGVAKGATLTHRNLIANMLQNEAWSQPGLRSMEADQTLIIVCALPLYHIFALTTCFLFGARAGGMNILIPNPRDMAGMIKELTKYRFNILPAVNTLFNGLVNHPAFGKLDFSSLKLCMGGGMAVQSVVNQKWRRVTGCVITEGYGLSETSPVATCNPTLGAQFNGSIGLPLPSTEILILDSQEQPVPIGEAGEIAIRGPQVMAGYWNRPDETALVMTADGFFKTGDIGIMDQHGFVRIVDRKKDMILVSGFNVYPNEIEAVVAAHPGVLECACIGVTDANTGEAVKVFVVRRDPALDIEQLRAHCKEQLTAYKKPKHIEFRESLPKSPVGKILRRELRDQTPN